MLNYIELENFRAFSKRVRIEVRPITVLIGKNSSGKSSVLKFLQMLRQTVGRREGEFFETSGEHVKLGAWADLRNKRSRSHHFGCRLGYRGQSSAFMSNIVVGKGGGSLSIQASPAKLEGKGLVFEKHPTLDYEITARRYYRAGGERGMHSVLIRQPKELDAPGTKSKPVFERALSALKGSSFLQPKPTSDSPQDVLTRIGEDMKFIGPAREWFAGIKHLAATRAEPEYTMQTGSPPTDEVGHKGEYTSAHLAGIISKSAKKRGFVERHIASVLHVDNLKAKDTIKGLLTRFEARNADTQATHWLADFGFGVSQCLPIFVQGALMEAGELLTVEQPESQLHPTAQLELGSFFAELWSERGVSSIIETHSGNILLRLRGLVRAGKLKPEDVSVAYFHAENSVTTVSNMAVKADGELDGDLPMEFFGADIFEALEMNAISPAKDPNHAK